MAPFLLVLLALLLLAPAPSLGAGVGGINITHILAGFPEFSAFSAMLTETSVAFAIEGRDKVTVLAPNNTAVSAAFPGLPPRVPRSFLADLLALHVVLDYIDEPKLGALQRGRRGEGSVLTTLLQATRTPLRRGAGFLRVYSGDGGRATFTSAAPAGPRNATVERLVAAQPNSVAVLHVSGFVVPPGISVPQPFPPTPRARHMAAPPGLAPAGAPGPAEAHAPIFGSGPLVPSPVRPMPTPYLIDTPPPVPVETEVIPIPSVHGGMAAKLPSAAGHSAAIWWTGVAAVIGIACMHLHL